MFTEKKKYYLKASIILFLIALFLPLGLPHAQEEGTPTEELKTESAVQNPVPPQEGVAEAEVKRGISLIQLIKYGGIVGHSIILLSFIAVGLAIEYAFSIRHAKIAPPKDIAVIRNLISEHKIEVLKKLDQKKASYLTQVVIAGLHEVSLGYEVMIKAMEDASEALSAQIARKVEHLNVISNIAPMLGLLGTVTGMLRCFYTISQIRGSVEPQMLARGIFEALVTTVEGLIVAIPTLYLYAIFRNRVDECTGRASLIAEELLTSFKFENNQGQGE